MYLNNLLSANFDLGIMPNPDRERTEQNKFYGKPSHIEFLKDSERILRSSLLSVEPEEGCALLIGDFTKSKNKQMHNIFKIQLIWPCCNVWTNKSLQHTIPISYPEMNDAQVISKRNRFALDPKEQIFAQKWARSRGLKVIGSAHSHPASEPIPSKIDIQNCYFTNLMIILNGCNEMRAWWVNNEDVINPLELPFAIENQRSIT